MKKVLIGIAVSSLLFSQGLTVHAAEKSKAKKAVKVDKDKNGIADDWQKKYRLGKGAAVAKQDADKDGLTNLQEYQLSLNPKSKDTDKDKVSDGQEDYDKDGLTNLQDIKAKLSPLRADSDKDGMKDAAEDNDLDGLNTKEEYIVGTNPVSGDTDKDRIIDGEEDADQDGIDNSVEFDLGYHPKKGDSDGDGIKDLNEDLDGDGVSNGDEVAEFEIEAVDADGREFEFEYEVSKKKSKLKVKDEIGIADAQTIMERLVLSPSVTEEELTNQVQEALGNISFAELKIKVEFVNGQELEVEHASEDEQDEE